MIDNLYFVRRTKGNVIVSIMYSKTDNKYHFVNLTKSHICHCCFNTVEDAILDMDQLKNEGKIIEYYKMENWMCVSRKENVIG